MTSFLPLYSKEIEKIKDELSLQRMKALAESQRVLELERKLFTTDRHLKLSQSENMKLRVSLDELKMKYEPDGTKYVLYPITQLKQSFQNIHLVCSQ